MPTLARMSLLSASSAYPLRRSRCGGAVV